MALYSSALAVIVPSRMEGWGLPAGEALWCGTPVICSTAPALREVCGELALYFDPDSPQDLAKHLIRMTTDESFAKTQRAKTKKAKLSFRTWHIVANDIRNSLQLI